MPKNTKHLQSTTYIKTVNKKCPISDGFRTLTDKVFALSSNHFSKNCIIYNITLILILYEKINAIIESHGICDVVRKKCR